MGLAPWFSLDLPVDPPVSHRLAETSRYGRITNLKHYNTLIKDPRGKLSSNFSSEEKMLECALQMYFHPPPP